ncbi:MAG: phage integrase SAM-like domain-containing protein [Pirellulales bacterium]
MRLANLGIIGGKEASPPLGKFLRNYVSQWTDMKAATSEIWRHTARNLNDHFGKNRDLATITPGDADDFKQYLNGLKLAKTTVSKRRQFARSFFRAAVWRRIITENPFADVSQQWVCNRKRHFVSREETERLLEVADPTFRVIIALGRYGALRVPCEALSLRWDDVDLASGRMTVSSPKTEHHQGGD